MCVYVIRCKSPFTCAIAFLTIRFWAATCSLSIAETERAIFLFSTAETQDLKTGFLLGATPRRQQVGEIIGALTSSLVIGAVVILLHKSFTIGSEALPAPQATLMKLVVEGVIDQNLPWSFVLIGVFIALCIELLGLPSLPFSVGLYLPIGLSTPIIVGGIMRWFVEKRNKGK